jgi:predicted rRNA methylase YqxC with S4 and FtsJ domains
MPARDYREMVGFDVKRGQLPDDLRQLKSEQVFENKTVKNLKAGKKFWYKKGQPGCGVYRRSAQTMERLHKGTKNL